MFMRSRCTFCENLRRPSADSNPAKRTNFTEEKRETRNLRDSCVTLNATKGNDLLTHRRGHREPLPRLGSRDQLPVMLVNHGGRVSRLQADLGDVLSQGDPIADERMAQGIVLPG